MSSPAATLTAPVAAPVAGTPAEAAAFTPRRALLDSLMPLLVDVGVPLVSYYVLKAAGLGTFGALAWSSVVPAVRTAWGVARDRRLNALAALMVSVNAVGLLLSLVAGDPRLMLLKDSAVSSTIGLVVLVTALRGRPMMTAGLRPWLTRGEAVKSAAWQRLSTESTAFRRAEVRFSAVWGAALVAECAVRAVGAYTLPVETMVWAGTVVLGVAMVLAFVVSGRIAVAPMERMIEDAAAEER
ncbi:VC0807 family protein [Streptomyces sp. ITFR-16]|uniref:VC0807 family protein n=1 Tax=Streptomyces sp. ITFR-16 TaxID=3075198 RepID=UPI00288B6393|nr:VC0807 family protein [Streptomyces sp. ITFR-16]WNI24720.1 VC0807 family protein [Streptomyces sp. ITFR-16]